MKQNRIARIAMAVVGSALAGTALAAPASSESVSYSFDKSPYVKSISINNGAAEVVVTVKARTTPKTVDFAGWGVSLDTVADHSSDFGPEEFYAAGTWNRSGVKLFAYFDDGSYDQTRVDCDGLRTISRKKGLVKKIVIPRFCMTIDDVAATAVRAQVGVYGTRTKPAGCWGVGAPRRGFTDWLDPEPAAGRVVATSTRLGTSHRGC